MFKRAASSGSGSGADGVAKGVVDLGPLPNLAGDLDELMSDRPVFHVRLHGYDRLEVDNYAAWADGEIDTLRRQNDHLLGRYGEAAAELEISRRLLADVPKGRDVFPVSERVKEMLRLAADEAASLTEAGEAEADRLLAEARTEADAWLRKAHEIKEQAVAAADELLEQARRERAQAAAERNRAAGEAAALLREAAAERERLAEEAARERAQAAAEAREHLAVIQAEVDDLRRQRDDARQSLRELTDRIGDALQAVIGTLPDLPADDRPVVTVLMGNTVVDDLPVGGRQEPVAS
jgi:cell division septum initiation protein DivIVA